MVIPEIRQSIDRSLWRHCRQCVRVQRLDARRSVSTTTASSSLTNEPDLEESSFEVPQLPDDAAASFDPVRLARKRRTQLPASRYQFRPPKYYRGPLHPHQPPKASDPVSREFIPGPFSLPRMEQTYQGTLAQDLMALTYSHTPPGAAPPPMGQRLRTWEGDSPYFANRPLRAPKGGSVLRPIQRKITFRNVPQLERITVHSMASEAGSGESAYLHVMGLVIQTITNVRVKTHVSKTNVLQWGLKKGKFTSVTAELRGEDMYHFLSKVIDLVMPRIKDYKGLKGSSGDGTGNLSFGFEPEAVSLFPEIEVNYDMYPPKMIPGCHITVHTTATNDKEARLLLTAIGMPFFGKLKM